MEGIIYRIQPYQEHARLLFVYGPEGKKTLIAQGAQKINNPQRILAQFLTKIAFRNTEKPMAVLAEVKLMDDYHVIKTDFNQTKHAALILEIIDQCVTDQLSHPAIYHEMSLALAGPNLELSALSFALKMLKPLGYAMAMDPDGRPIKGVQVEKGGLVYKGENIPVDLDIKTAVDLLKLSVVPYPDLPTLNTQFLDKIKTFVLKYYQYHLQTTLKNIQ